MFGKLQTWWNFRRAVNQLARGELDRTSTGRDVVVLPCWRRPEFLWHCLDNIAQAEGATDLIIMLRPDTGHSADNLEVVRSFADRLPNIVVSYPAPSAFRRTKQSANVLLGYLEAAAQARQFVFLIEEDVMVARDYFRWHREVHAAATNLFCSIASKNTNRKLTVPQDVTGYYLSAGDYCSIGVCFDKQILTKMIAPYVNMAYLRRPKKYIRRHFPTSPIGLGFVEQDGLIRRIQENATHQIAWPCVPRAFHAGFYGYNRSGGIEGGLSSRIKLLADTIYDRNSMRQATGQAEDDDLSVPTDLQLPPWRTLHHVDPILAN
jgi:hypothetical protein